MTEAGESQRQFGRRVGLSPTRINQLIKEGLSVLANGRIDSEVAIHWLEQNLDRERSVRARQGAASAAGQGASRPVAAAPVVPDGPLVPFASTPVPPTAAGSAVAAPMAEVRRQHELVKVARARLRLETEKGRLVSRDEIKVTIFNRARRERNSHLAWVLRVAPLMALELAPTVLETGVAVHLPRPSSA